MKKYQLTQSINQLSLKPSEEEIKKKGLMDVILRLLCLPKQGILGTLL